MSDDEDDKPVPAISVGFFLDWAMDDGLPVLFAVAASATTLAGYNLLGGGLLVASVALALIEMIDAIRTKQDLAAISRKLG